MEQVVDWNTRAAEVNPAFSSNHLKQFWKEKNSFISWSDEVILLLQIFFLITHYTHNNYIVPQAQIFLWVTLTAQALFTIYNRSRGCGVQSQFRQ